MLACLLVAGTVTSTQPALAGEDGAPSAGSTGSDELQPPELREFHEADYPAAALEAKVEGTVVLTLVIDTEGRVERARVEQGPGHGLNEAARSAAEQFVFRPARRGGRPVRARIRYRYEFELPERTAEGDDPSARESDADSKGAPESGRGRLHGKLRAPGAQSAGGVRVKVVGPDDESRTLTTNADGGFETGPLPPGRYEVVAPAGADSPSRTETEVLAGQTTDVTLRLASGSDEPAIEVTVRGESEGKNSSARPEPSMSSTPSRPPPRPTTPAKWSPHRRASTSAEPAVSVPGRGSR
ncbi:MAG: TonB family protein [Bradymonadaceae bacterium]